MYECTTAECSTTQLANIQLNSLRFASFCKGCNHLYLQCWGFIPTLLIPKYAASEVALSWIKGNTICSIYSVSVQSQS